MKNQIKSALVTIFSILTFASVSHGAWSFSNLSDSDFGKLMKEMGSNTSMHSVLPPSSLGDVWGFEIGLTGGFTKSPFVDELAKRVDVSTDVSKIPHGGLLGAVTVPFGITGEFLIFPATESGDVKYSQSALAFKWTFTDVFLTELPVNMAVRVFSSKSDLDWKQTQSGTVFVASNSNKVAGYQFLISPKLWVVEPYAGFGLAKTTGSLTQNGGAVAIFADGSRSKQAEISGSQLIVGLDAKLLFFGMGLEWMRSFDNDSYTLKLSMKF